MPKKSGKTRRTCLRRRMRLPKMLMRLLFDKKAVSVAVSTMIITAGVVAMGITVLYWTYSWGNIANKQYMDNMQSGSNALGERIAFEYISYSGSDLTVNMINWGKTNNVTIARVYIYDGSHEAIGTYSGNDTALRDIGTHNEIAEKGLNVGKDGCIIINLGSALNSYSNSTIFTIQVVTERGRNFEGSFAI
jgi:hypothetical protein